MKTIIAGSRTIEGRVVVEQAIEASGWADRITQVVSGVAEGVDRLGEAWAYRHNIPIARFPAAWKIYGKAAGPIRNAEMAVYAEALIAVWDGESRGTRNMIDVARRHGLQIYIHEVNQMAKINTTAGSIGMRGTAATCVALETHTTTDPHKQYIDTHFGAVDLPRLGGALASEAYPSLFDEPAPVRPIRLVTVVCAICRATVQISFLADGKLCDLCRMDLPLAASNISADLDKAEKDRDAANEVWLAAYIAATPKDQDRYTATEELRQTLHLNGKLYTEVQVNAALQKAVAQEDGLSILLRADAIRHAADYNLRSVRAWSDVAMSELHAAGWREGRLW